MRPEIDYAGRAIQGEREDQEDFYAFEQLEGGRLLLVIADGAGGQASGELASRNATMGFLDCFAQSSDTTVPTLFAALQEGNRRLAAFMNGDPSQRATMATTLLALVVEGRTLNWISVGDSPLLLFRDGTVTRLNADHSMAAHMGDSILSRNILRSALVGGRIPIIDWRREPYALREKDILIAASDGIWTLSLGEIAAHLSSHAATTASDITHDLLQLLKAKSKTHQDNVTIGVIKAGTP
jgi:serine/threonine protein phosphatase PrpC